MTMTPQIETLPLDSLIPYANNARTHSEEQVAQISASIREFGFTNPVLIDKAGTIIAGHGRVMAARKLGLADVPCLRLEHLTPSQVKAYVLADNRLAMNAGWDEELLKVELRTLTEDGFDTSLLGFTDDELTAFLNEDPLAGVDGGTAGALTERFGFPPFSVLNAREGKWQERKREWLTLGIASEIGRDDSLVFDVSSQPVATYQLKNAFDEKLGRKSAWAEFAEAHPEAIVQGGTSIFDPVLTELCYAWFCPEHGNILDPFAGGSVRGVVASRMKRNYVGVDLRGEQVEANRKQGEMLCEEYHPVWHQGDSREVVPTLEGTFDFIFSCPPYADLERYSEDPKDLSTMDYPEFVQAYDEIIAKACTLLTDDAFACFIVGEVRGDDGNFYGFVPDTIRAFEKAGLRFYNEGILVTAVGSLAIRVGRQFDLSRKLGRTHQNILVFVKGDPKKAAEKCGKVDLADLEDLQEEGEVSNG